MKVGDLVQVVNCNNSLLNGKIGTIVLREHREKIYGLCVMIGGRVYGFEDYEIEVVMKAGKSRCW